MEEYYYLDSNGSQCGPIPASEFTRYGVTPDTYVWKVGMASWQKASQLPELADLFYSIPPVPPTVQAQVNPNRPQRPETNLVWAILATLCCCLPLGVVSIVYAAQVDGFYNTQQYDKALEYSQNARKWAIISAVVGLVSSAVYTIFILIAGIGDAGLLDAM